MSFRCDSCHMAQPPRTKPNRVAIEVRSKFYDPSLTSRGPAGWGWEIVEEGNFCGPCTPEPPQLPLSHAHMEAS